MRYLFLFPLLFLCCVMATAQPDGVRISGRVLDVNSRQPIEFATIFVADAATDDPLTGTTTDTEGYFEAFTEAENFYVEIRFIGYDAQVFTNEGITAGRLDLGTILLSEHAETFDEVVVRAERSQTEFRLDKRVFNVGQDLSTTGASALEVLNNVPSVNVSIEGQISLRGSAGVQILLDGKPTVLAAEGGNALGTITADMIDRIEVITNPSAKYDAEGTSGIINIVMKKEEKKGLNGSATINTGIPNNHSLGLSLNRRTDKFNLFSQLGFGHRTFPEQFRTINQDLQQNTTVAGEGNSDKNETFLNLILGTDYHINPNNVISLSGHFAYEWESEFADTDFTYTDPNGTPASGWNRDEETEAVNPKWAFDLQYKRDFQGDEDHTLLASVLGNFFGKDQSSTFINTTRFGDANEEQQQTRTDFQEAEYTFKLDYTRPLAEQFSIEAGAQYIINDVSNDFETLALDNDTWQPIPDLTNIFDFTQKVLGVYGTGAFENDAWGIKLGLRLEHTNVYTLLENTNESNTQDYSNLFPTAHTSYKVNDNLSLQAGYSRRIFRPRLWDLNPFFNIRNNFNIRTGNPNLLPEFTDSYEITGIYILGQLSLNLALYHRYTTDVVERISFFEDNVTVTRPENVGTNRATGVEFNGKYSPTRWLTLNANANVNYFKREGTLETTIIDFEAEQWSTQLNAKLKLPAQFDFEITGFYNSPYQTVQGEMSGNAFADLGLRKKIMGGKGVLNLSIRDLFASRIMESNTLQPTFSVYSWRLRGRFVTVGFSYGFGKGEAMEFSGQKMF